ncbi:uncharacterized protein LOC106709498 [Papilio machaon]|uniref:uncharacterized protein LOC106709498 n=1 Tax=Papilio machaon TaxID=76193 RepID=UPI001E6637D9|nr:uncharacterized protein LOC106709498 [Papilio machaon]
MTSGSSGAVFFLGTRAHYQVLDQPESRFDSENGNTSTETIYQNHSSQELWPKPQTSYDDVDRRNWNCEGDVTVTYEKEKQEIGVGVKRRTKRRQSEAALCEELRPAALNCLADNEVPKPKPRRVSLLNFLSSLARRKPRLESDQVQYLRHLESALTNCTYRESCRCLDCQSRYFECDESDEEYSSDESEYTPRYTVHPEPIVEHDNDDSDDEVFTNSVAGDNTSTDLLLDTKEKMSISSDPLDEEAGLELEVAAGTPVLLNYLLTHPITCSIQ